MPPHSKTCELFNPVKTRKEKYIIIFTYKRICEA